MNYRLLKGCVAYWLRESSYHILSCLKCLFKSERAGACFLVYFPLISSTKSVYLKQIGGYFLVYSSLISVKRGMFLYEKRVLKATEKLFFRLFITNQYCVNFIKLVWKEVFSLFSKFYKTSAIDCFLLNLCNGWFSVKDT